MAKRVLTAEEAAALGLEAPAPRRRVLSPKEAAALGLPAPTGGPISQEPGDLAQPPRRPGIHGAMGPAPDFASEVPEGYVGAPRPADVPDAPEAYTRGFGQTATLGYGDEAQGGLGAVEALNNRLRTAVGMEDLRPQREQQLAADLGEKPLGVELSDAYRGGRNKDRAYNQEAETAQPGPYLGGNLVGALALPVPGPGKASTLGRLAKAGLNVAKTAGLGALGGLGASKADLTTGDVAGAARDTGVGAGVGAGVGLGGELLGALAGKFGGKVANAEAAAVAKATAEKEKEIASALGKYRSGVQSASRDLEVLQAAAADAAHPMHQEAVAFLQTPEANALRAGVTGNKLATAPERLAEMESLKGAHQQLVAGKQGAIDAASSEALSPLTAAKKLGKFAYNYGTRMGPALGGALLGFNHGGAQGGVLGTALGGVLGMVAGHGGTAAKNLYKSPGAQRALFSVLAAGARAPAALAGQTALPAFAAEQLGPLLESLMGDDDKHKAMAEALARSAK